MGGQCHVLAGMVCWLRHPAGSEWQETMRWRAVGSSDCDEHFRGRKTSVLWREVIISDHRTRHHPKEGWGTGTQSPQVCLCVTVESRRPRLRDAATGNPLLVLRHSLWLKQWRAVWKRSPLVSWLICAKKRQQALRSLSNRLKDG